MNLIQKEAHVCYLEFEFDTGIFVFSGKEMIISKR